MLPRALEGQKGLQSHHNSEEHIKREHLAVYRMNLPFPKNQQQHPSSSKKICQKVIPDYQRDDHEYYKADIVFSVSGVVMVDLQDQVEHHPKENIARYVEVAEVFDLSSLGTH